MDLEYFRRSLWGHLKMTQPDGNHDDFYLTRKCPLRGHCLAPPGRRQRITLKREKNFGLAELWVTGDGQTDVEFEIVF